MLFRAQFGDPVSVDRTWTLAGLVDLGSRARAVLDHLVGENFCSEDDVENAAASILGEKGAQTKGRNKARVARRLDALLSDHDLAELFADTLVPLSPMRSIAGAYTYRLHVGLADPPAECVRAGRTPNLELYYFWLPALHGLVLDGAISSAHIPFERKSTSAMKALFAFMSVGESWLSLRWVGCPGAEAGWSGVKAAELGVARHDRVTFTELEVWKGNLELDRRKGKDSDQLRVLKWVLGEAKLAVGSAAYESAVDRTVVDAWMAKPKAKRNDRKELWRLALSLRGRLP